MWWRHFSLGLRRVFGQHGEPVNANACFSDLLVNHYDFNQNTDIKFRLLSLWNQELYEKSRMDSALFTAYGAGNLNLSQDKVLRELEINDQSIDYNRVTAIHTTTLDQQATAIINNCINHLTSGYGIHSKVEIEDERYLDLTVYWDDPNGKPLKFKKQEIFNGNVLNDRGSHPTVPFVTTDTGYFSRWHDAEIPSGSSRTIRVERTGPYQQVVFNFVVSPDIVFAKISIDPVPEKVKYKKNQLAKNPLNDQPLHKEWVGRTWDQDSAGSNNGLIQTSDDGNRHHHYAMAHSISEVSDDPTAVFVRVICEKYGSAQDYADLDGAVPSYATSAVGQGVGTTKATCSGWWELPGRSIIMKVDYQVTSFVPENQTWSAWYPVTPQKQ